MNNSLKTVFLCAVLLAAKTANSQTEPCPHDISPCTCLLSDDTDVFRQLTVDITCNGKDFQNGQQLQSKLRKNQQGKFNLTLHDVTFDLPKNLIGDNELEHLEFSCSSKSTSPGHIKSDSFQELSSQATSLVIKKCNFTDEGFSFLGSFSILRSFTIEDSDLKEFGYFPVLERLQTLILNHTSTEKLFAASIKTPNLQKISLIGVNAKYLPGMFKELSKIDDILILSLSSNGLESIPKEISKFKDLRLFEIADNPLKILKNGSLHFKHVPSRILLPMNQITEIEPNAIQGNFSHLLTLNLRNNKLTQLKEEVFKPILDSMNQNNGSGVIDLGGNNLVCGCDVRWLIQSNRHLLKHFDNAYCISKDRDLTTLESSEFNHCPGSTGNGGKPRTSHFIVFLAIVLSLLFTN